MLVTKKPGRDRVDRDAVGGELERDIAGQVRATGLRGHVRRSDHRFGLDRRQRRGDDDPAGSLGSQVSRRRPDRREHAVEVDVDHPVPPLVGVRLERTVVVARPLGSGPPADEAGARVDARVGEGDVEPAVRRDRGVERGIEAGVIGHVDDLAANVVARTDETSDLGLDGLAVDIEDRHRRAVLRQRLGERQSQAARATGDDDAVPLDAEQLGTRHRLRPVAPRRRGRAAPTACPRSARSAPGPRPATCRALT